MLTFISGGVRSGKSTYAELIVSELQVNRKVYIATSIPYDDEMKKRVNKHQEDRKSENWTTIEKASDLSDIVSLLRDDDVILIDCLTLWLSNEMFSDEINIDVVEKMLEAIKIIMDKVKDIVIVSNDIFSGVPNYDETTEAFVRNLGRLHIEIVKSSDSTYELISGMAIKRKGE